MKTLNDRYCECINFINELGNPNSVEEILVELDVEIEKVKICPKCKKDSLITMSDGIYCMNDSCNFYKKRNV